MLRTEQCVMSGIGGRIETFQSNVVHVKIGTAYGKDLEILIQTKPVLTNEFPAVKLCPMDQDFLQERNILICNPHIRGELHTPQVIVGLDYYYNFVVENGDICRTPSGLRMASTIFGPTVYGRGLLETQNDVSMTMITHSMTAIDETEHELLTKLFELEGIGISPNENAEGSQVVEYYKEYSKKISFENGVVTAPFPLTPEVADLADNYSSAIKRLISLHRQLECNPVQKHWYWKIMEQYENDDIIEKVDGEMPNSAGVYYMPHSGVWREHKPKPLRIVFDASSKRKGQLSLNDVTLKGESLINKIHDILVASRVSNIIVLCDIEAAFTQIRLHKHHRDLCRFLWLKDRDRPPTRDNVVEYRFKRVPFGAKPSPSILNMSLLTFLKSKKTPLAEEILANLYVDNILFCASSPNEAVAKYEESKQLFAEIGMNLREYVSNCEEVNQRIPAEDRLASGIIKILGVTYDTRADRFHLTLRFPYKDSLSKKDVVSQLNSVYDPIGIAAPLTVRLKHRMREIYDCGSDWKQLLPEQQAKQWNEACQELNNVSISLPRYVGNPHASSKSSMTLWVFADASSIALATCAFIRNEDTREVSPLISGKTRLSPKKTKQTIPRLELVAILMAMRLARTITTAIKKGLLQINVLSDSEIALSWLKSAKTLPAFITNQRDRIMKIRETLQGENVKLCFFHVTTESNAADAGTRGVHPAQMNALSWVYGPKWLSEDEVPERLTPLTEIHGIESEDNEEKTDWPTIEVNATIQKAVEHSNWIDLSRYSRLNTVTRVIARVGKMLHRWVAKVNSRKNGRRKSSFQK
nr:Retrotransposon domain containing protein [Haemonchus contortus]